MTFPVKILSLQSAKLVPKLPVVKFPKISSKISHLACFPTARLQHFSRSQKAKDASNVRKLLSPPQRFGRWGVIGFPLCEVSAGV